MKATVIVLFSMVFLSCSPEFKAERKAKRDAPYNSWLGAHKSQIIQSWGPPARTTSNGKGGEILIFNTGWQVVRYTTYYYYTMYYADENGKLYYWKRFTETVPPSQLIFR